MKLPSPQQFAKLLRLSIIPDEAKEIILEKLPNLNKRQIIAVYQKLGEGQEKVQQAKAEFESKINFSELKFDQQICELKRKIY